ncbi:WD repeat protein Lub1 [Savitreella phatthalungensis]
MNLYKLSRTLLGHEKDVRGVAASGETIVSCSRDGTIKIWPAGSQGEHRTWRLHEGFVNAIATSGDHIVSGGQDSAIYLTSIQNEELRFALLGHSSNVCALSVDTNNRTNRTILSGSWDGTARLWKDTQCLYTLSGHEGAVWAVLATQQGILTAGADKTIRLWKDGRQIKVLFTGADCIRTLALHPTGFVSAGNDAIIRLHNAAGEVLQELHGHESFIYQVQVDEHGTIFSVGEDRSLRCWVDGRLEQTIHLPTVSVWALAIMGNGDIVTGSSDAAVRVWTKTPARMGSEQALLDFEKEVELADSSSQLGGQQIPDYLPGLQALAEPGKRDGEIKMVRLNESLVEAHEWSGGIWVKVGDVVGAEPSKIEFEGCEYDFVFDVDVAEGRPPLKLPLNLKDNPHNVAQRFIERHGLDTQYFDQIVRFIENNTGDARIGLSRKESALHSAARISPQTHCLAMTSGDKKIILQKLESFDPDPMALETCKKLDLARPTARDLDAIEQLYLSLPEWQVFPAIDLLRLSLPKAPRSWCTAAKLQALLQATGLTAERRMDKIAMTNSMLGLRCLANLLALDAATGLARLRPHLEAVLHTCTEYGDLLANRNLAVAFSTFLLNIQVAACSMQDIETARLALASSSQLIRIQSTVDAEAQYRALVGVCTSLTLGESIREFASTSLKAALRVSYEGGQEARIREASAKALAMLSD